MILPVAVYGHPVLRKVARNITPDYSNLPLLIENMFETLYHSEGVGLAAPQVNLSIRLFIVDATPYAEEVPEMKDFKHIFINAQIISRTGEENLFNEGCLSIPGIRENVKRPTIIKMRYLDENFHPHEKLFDGIAARIIQHEYDHLEGILFVDRLSSLRKKLLKSKLRALEHNKYNVKYRTILNKI